MLSEEPSKPKLLSSSSSPVVRSRLYAPVTTSSSAVTQPISSTAPSVTTPIAPTASGSASYVPTTSATSDTVPTIDEDTTLSILTPSQGPVRRRGLGGAMKTSSQVNHSSSVTPSTSVPVESKEVKLDSLPSFEAPMAKKSLDSTSLPDKARSSSVPPKPVNDILPTKPSEPKSAVTTAVAVSLPTSNFVKSSPDVMTVPSDVLPKETVKLPSQSTDETQKIVLKMREDQQTLNNELKLSARKYDSEISILKNQYEDKILDLNAQITKVTKEHLEELSLSRQKYEEKIQSMETNFKREKQTLLATEATLRKQVDSLSEQLVSEKRQMQKSHEDAIALLKTEKESAIRAAERKASDEIAHFAALHKDAVEVKERQLREEMDLLRQRYEKELHNTSNLNTTSQSIGDLIQQVQTSTTVLKSIQKQVTTELTTNLEERETHLKNREMELEKREELFAKQQRDNEKEQKKWQTLLTQMELRVRELQQSAEEERRQLQQDSRQLETRRFEFELEMKNTREAIEKEQRKVHVTAEEKVKERETFLAECLQERKALVEERRTFEETKRRLTESDEGSLRKIREREVQLEAERIRLQQERADLTQEKDTYSKEKMKIIQERLQLEKDQTDFQVHTDQLTKMAAEIQHKSAQVSAVHDQALQDRLEAQKCRDEADTLYIKIAAHKAQTEEKGNELAAIQKATGNLSRVYKTVTEKQRLEMAKERKKLLEEKEASIKLIHAARQVQAHLKISPTQHNELLPFTTMNSTELTKEDLFTSSTPLNRSFSGGDLNAKSLNTTLHTSTELRKDLTKWTRTRQASQGTLRDQANFLHSLSTNT